MMFSYFDQSCYIKEKEKPCSIVEVMTGIWKLLFQYLFAYLVLSSYLGVCNAGITSSFVRSEFPSVDIPLNSRELAIPPGYNAPQQVHITQGDYDGRGVIVSWVTFDEPGSSQVLYGTKEDNYDYKSEGKFVTYTFGSYESGYIHHCLVEGLEYDTKYYYKIGLGDSSRKFWFVTPPKIGPDASYTFGIIGDLGQTYNSLSTLEHYMQSFGKTVLYVGDLSYADAYENEMIGIRWDSWGRLIERSVAYQPWIWSIGNHEIEYMPDKGEIIPFKSYLNRYRTPYTCSRSSSPLWYAIRRASSHIIVLSSYSPFVKYTPQWFWLKNELKKVDRETTPWLIVLMHVPIYNSNTAHYMEGESIRAVFESWFVQYKVDMVFAGHVHAYERSYRISNINYNITNGDRYPTPNKYAPIYLTVGDGGNHEGLAGRFTDQQPDYSAFREASYGHSTLEIKNRTHAFYHWNRNDDGKQVSTDSVVIHNQYWSRNLQRRKLERFNRLPEIERIATH